MAGPEGSQAVAFVLPEGAGDAKFDIEGHKETLTAPICLSEPLSWTPPFSRRIQMSGADAVAMALREGMKLESSSPSEGLPPPPPPPTPARLQSL